MINQAGCGDSDLSVTSTEELNEANSNRIDSSDEEMTTAFALYQTNFNVSTDNIGVRYRAESEDVLDEGSKSVLI